MRCQNCHIGEITDESSDVVVVCNHCGTTWVRLGNVWIDADDAKAEQDHRLMFRGADVTLLTRGLQVALATILGAMAAWAAWRGWRGSGALVGASGAIFVFIGVSVVSLAGSFTIVEHLPWDKWAATTSDDDPTNTETR